MAELFNVFCFWEIFSQLNNLIFSRNVELNLVLTDDLFHLAAFRKAVCLEWGDEHNAFMTSAFEVCGLQTEGSSGDLVYFWSHFKCIKFVQLQDEENNMQNSVFHGQLALILNHIIYIYLCWTPKIQ